MIVHNPIRLIRHRFDCRMVIAACLLSVACVSCIAENTPSTDATTLVHVGEEAPDFMVEMFDGSTIRLSEQRPKVVLLVFFSSWCPTCRKELTEARRTVIDRFKGQEFVYLPISRGETRNAIAAFREENELDFPMGLDPEAEIYGKYATRTVPRNFLIDRQGQVVAASADYYEAALDALLSQAESLLAND